MNIGKDPVYYADYLKLDTLLDSQHPKSRAIKTECHDETLFIIVHQIYELWFKQILHEFKSISSIFNKNIIEEKELGLVGARLERVIKIQNVLFDQLAIMETMTPMDFLEFRDLLIPASGFQSVQFRELEILLGLKTNRRFAVDREYFMGRLSRADRERIEIAEQNPSLIELLQNWLERIPFMQNEKFNFWQEYQNSVDEILATDESIIANHQFISGTEKNNQMENFHLTKETFASLFDEKKHNELIQQGSRRLSQKATLGALFILLYRDEPILHQPFKIINYLMDIDEHMTAWRHRHAIMAQRMLGTKIGTGGSSGHHYLKVAAEKNRVFNDLFNLSTFLIPRSKLPILPPHIKKSLDFHFSELNE